MKAGALYPNVVASLERYTADERFQNPFVRREQTAERR
jgi:hypothetical protein